MSDTFDQHVRDYQRIEKNVEMIGLASVLRESSRSGNYHGFPVLVNDAAPKETIYLIPSAETLARVHARDPLEDLRRYFGCIKNVTV